MKNKKGFISISIIYSFFIVFLLILVLIMTTYMNNRYAYNIYTKDAKRYHANNNEIITNNQNAIEYNEHPGYYSHYYQIEETEGETAKITYVNYYYYTRGHYRMTEDNVKMSNGQVFNFYIYLGGYDEHNTNYTSFFNTESMHYQVTPTKEETYDDRKIIIYPSLRKKYSTWEEAVNNGLINELNETLIESIGQQLVNVKEEETPTFMGTCVAKGCKINITYIGYNEGADALLYAAAKEELITKKPEIENPTTKYFYYIINSGITTIQSSETLNDTTIKNNLNTNISKITACGTENGNNYLNRMNSFYSKYELTNEINNDESVCTNTEEKIIIKTILNK